MCEGRLIADVVAAIGSIDIVLGEWIDKRLVAISFWLLANIGDASFG